MNLLEKVVPEGGEGVRMELFSVIIVTIIAMILGIPYLYLLSRLVSRAWYRSKFEEVKYYG